MTPRNELERQVVDAVLRELRFAVKARAPCTIVIDPFYDRTGVFILASSDAKARRYECLKAQRT